MTKHVTDTGLIPSTSIKQAPTLAGSTPDYTSAAYTSIPRFVEPSRHPPRKQIHKFCSNGPDATAGHIRRFVNEIFHLARRDVLLIQRGRRPATIQTNDDDRGGYLLSHCQGKSRIGVFPHLDGNTCRFAVVDFDCHRVDESLARSNDAVSRGFQQALLKLDIHSAREQSKTLGSYHIWILFDEEIPVPEVRLLIRMILQGVVEPSHDLGKIEIFPKSDALSPGGYGNAVFLPMFPPDLKKSRTVFVDSTGSIAEVDIRFNSAEKVRLAVGALQPQVTTIQPHDKLPGGQLISYYAPAVEGERHDRLCQLVGHLKSQKLAREEVLSIAGLWGAGCHPPFPATEIRSTVLSLLGNDSIEPSRISRFEVQRGEAMRTIKIARPPDLIRGVIRASSVAFLGGEEGTGKSLLAMQLGISVASGASKFLNWEIESAGPVVYLNAELFHDEFVHRFQMMTKICRGAESLDRFMVPTSVPLLHECADALESLLRETQPKLLILDCLYWLTDANEQDNSEMRMLMRQITEIRNRHKLCVLVVHHVRKNTKDQRLDSHMLRGAGAISAAADEVLLMRRSSADETLRIMKPTKLRYDADENKQPRGLRLDTASLWFDDVGSVKEDEHVAMASARERVSPHEIFESEKVLPSKEIVDRLRITGMSRPSAFRWLRSEVMAGRLEKGGQAQYTIKGTVS